jgi:hypothetical protein
MRSSTAAVLCSLVAAAWAGCGPPPTPAPPPPPASMPASAPASRPAGPTGVITRAELKAFLDRGMPAFIANVIVDRYPRARSRRFRGWRIVEFFPGDPRFAHVDLKPGDVVLRVNQRSIERPDQFVGVWGSLGQIRELVVEVLRQREVRVLRWRVAD